MKTIPRTWPAGCNKCPERWEKTPAAMYRTRWNQEVKRRKARRMHHPAGNARWGTQAPSSPSAVPSVLLCDLHFDILGPCLLRFRQMNLQNSVFEVCADFIFIRIL